MSGQPDSSSNQPAFRVEKLYLKDFSFENPLSPEIYMEEIDPQVDFNLATSTTRKGEDHYEVTIRVTVKVTSEDKPLFLIEVVYGGLFLLQNFPDEHLSMMLGIECPHIIFPYVRQIVSQTVTDGGFKPLIFDPINFAHLYQQARAEQQAE